MAKRVPFAWEKSYPAGVLWDAPLVMTTLPAVLDRAVAEFTSKTAFEYRGHTISYSELGQLVEKAARGLAALGVTRNTSVALYLPNTPWHPIFFFGILKTGARAVHLSPLDAERELAHKLTDSGAQIIITTDLGPLSAVAQSLLDKGLASRLILARDARWGGAETPALAPDPRILDASAVLESEAPAFAAPVILPDDVAVLQYTGGTTGLPKAAMLTHGNFTSTVSIYDAWAAPSGQVIRGQERVLLVLPLFHIYALNAVMVPSLASGATIHLRPRFDAAATIEDIQRHKLTSFPGVPTMWIAIANHPDSDKADFSSLKSVRSGGAACPVEIEKRILLLTGQTLGGGWGMTETAPAGTGIPIIPGVKTRNGVIGLPLPGIEMDVVAIDDPRRVLPPGQTGEIRIKGPNVIKSYWNKPDENAKAFVDGFFLTGDIGHMDEDGFFTIVDRKKDMIISGGFNVYPRNIEEAIYEHPDVAEAVVIGVPDSYRGEAAKAFVALKSGAAPFTLDALRDFLASRIGRHEMPAHLEFRDTLPKTSVGKLSKKVLVDQERAKQGAA
jgi:long-chain acyl-CoA synthetase